MKSTYGDYFPYNIGGTKSSIANGGSMILDFDAPDVGPRDGQIGYGKYKIDFYVWNGLAWELGNYCYIDFSDSDYPYSPGPWSMQNDISIYYHWNHEITYYGNNPIPSIIQLRFGIKPFLTVIPKPQIKVDSKLQLQRAGFG